MLIAAYDNGREGAVPAIETRDLVRRYDDLVAVDGVSLQVAEGEIFGFIGPNGAGKTTTISILATLIRPSGGRAWVAGRDVVAEASQVRRHIGIVFQESTLDTKLSVAENLDFHARIYRVEDRKRRVAQMLSLVELDDWRDKLVDRLSGGMRRRLEVARALLHRPRVLFLDEPTLGLDVQNRHRIWTAIRKLVAEDGITVFLTTHQLENAELCHRIGIIDHGRLVACDTPTALKRSLGGGLIRLECSDPAPVLRRARADGHDAAVDGRNVTVAVDNPAAYLPDLLRNLEVPIVNLQVEEPKLEDVFLALTGRRLRDEEAGKSGAWRNVHRASSRRTNRR
jgi:ABC-2 type transport system ATP-binding protein